MASFLNMFKAKAKTKETPPPTDTNNQPQSETTVKTETTIEPPKVIEKPVSTVKTSKDYEPPNFLVNQTKTNFDNLETNTKIESSIIQPQTQNETKKFTFIKNKQQNTNNTNNVKIETEPIIENILNQEQLQNIHSLINQEIQNQNNQNEVSILSNKSNQPPKTEEKKGFAFLKKKNPDNQNSENLNFSQNQNIPVNKEPKELEDNLFSDLNTSEIKSMKSSNLNIQNNFVENVSVIENNDNDSVSLKNTIEIDPNLTTKSIQEEKPEESSKFKFLKKNPQPQPSTLNSTDDKKSGKFSFIKKNNENNVQNSENIREETQQLKQENQSSILAKNLDAEVKKENRFEPEEIRRRISEDFNRAEEQSKEVCIKIHKLKKKIIDKEKRLKKLKQEFENLQSLENLAIENNDFDEAQRIENQIEENKKESVNLRELINSDQKEMILYREQELISINNKIRSTDEVVKGMIKIKNSQNYELETFTNNEVSKHKNDQIKIKKMNEKLEILKNELEGEKILLKEEELKVNERIRSQSSEVFAELDELLNKKDRVNDEILELKKLLQLKYNELELLNKNIEQKEIEIDAIKSNFSPELTKLNIKTKRYYEDLRDFEEQEKQYAIMCENYAKEEAKINDKLHLMNKNILEMDNNILEYKENQGKLNEEVIEKESLLKKENNIKSKIYLINLNIEKTENIKNKNFEEIQLLEINNKRLDSDISTISLKIPKLEEEKQNFVLLKNFKEAGKISNELKQLKEEREKLTVKISDNKNKTNIMKESNLKLENEIENSISQKQIEERDLSFVQYEYLIISKASYENLYKNIKNKSTEEAKLIGDEIQLINSEIDELLKLSHVKERFVKNEIIPEPEVKIQENTYEIKLKNEYNLENENENDFKNIQEDENLEKSKEIENQEENVEGHSEIVDKLSPEEIELEKKKYEETILELEGLINLAVEAENYDKADEYQSRIDELKSKLEELNKN